jgi:hypothetical protein
MRILSAESRSVIQLIRNTSKEATLQQPRLLLKGCVAVYWPLSGITGRWWPLAVSWPRRRTTGPSDRWCSGRRDPLQLHWFTHIHLTPSAIFTVAPSAPCKFVFVACGMWPLFLTFWCSPCSTCLGDKAPLAPASHYTSYLYILVCSPTLQKWGAAKSILTRLIIYSFIPGSHCTLFFQNSLLVP